MPTKTVTDASFSADVLQSDKPVLVDFWADWCGPCKALAPTLDEIAEEYAGEVSVVKVDIVANEATAGRGALLAGVYALGLGLPFVVLGLAYTRALGAIAFVRRHQAWVTRIGGLMLVVVGLLLVSGLWDSAVTWIQVRLISDFEVSV